MGRAITPLLEILEKRIRANVVEAAQYPNKNASFGSGGKALALYESGINSIFCSGDPTGIQCACKTMVWIELARGLITQLEPGEFDKMGLNPQILYFHYITHNKSCATLFELKAGDMVLFQNNKNYDDKKGYLGAEHTIKTGYDLYYGWDVGERIHAAWRGIFLAAYNKQVSDPQDKIAIEDIPSRHYVSYFLNVPKLAQVIFDFRTTGTLPEGSRLNPDSYP